MEGNYASDERPLDQCLKDLASSDVYVGLFAWRYGYVPKAGNPEALSITEHEYRYATKKNIPRLIFLLHRGADWPVHFIDAVTHRGGNGRHIERFRAQLEQETVVEHFYGATDLCAKVKMSLEPLRPRPRESGQAWVKHLAAAQFGQLRVPGGHNVFSSFEPKHCPDQLLMLHLHTTPGRAFDGHGRPDGQRESPNDIDIIRDPVRPFESQIGIRRSSRPGGNPGTISLGGQSDATTFQAMYAALMDEDHRWLRMVLAEVAQDSEVLESIYEVEKDDTVRDLITKNPFAPEEVKMRGCVFCDQKNMGLTERFAEHGARLIHNDFPFGPHFHYVVFPRDPIHSWERIEVAHLHGMNTLIRDYLLEQRSLKGLHGAHGVRVGLNSSIRHLVLGKSTRSSGATVPHVHKQVWSMSPGGVNLGDHLAGICLLYLRHDIDYLARYVETLSKAGLALCEDENVVLYVPFGQIAKHELQIMLKRPMNTILEMTNDEIKSFSAAEFFGHKVAAHHGHQQLQRAHDDEAFFCRSRAHPLPRAPAFDAELVQDRREFHHARGRSGGIRTQYVVRR
jgi:hypothetical protein